MSKKEIKLAKYAGFCYGVKRAVETAKKLKRMGLSVDQIMKATDLSEKEIEKL